MRQPLLQIKHRLLRRIHTSIFFCSVHDNN